MRSFVDLLAAVGRGCRSPWFGWALAAVVALLPFALPKQFGAAPINVLLYVEIYLILALGLNIVVGFTGLLDLGYVVFMATGALTAVVMSGMRRTANGLDWPIGNETDVVGDLVFGFDGSIFVILLAAGLLCAVLGVLRGIPTLRVRGDYFAIVTLGIAEIYFETALWDESMFVNMTQFTGGAFGAKIATSDYPTLFGTPLGHKTPHFYYLLLGLVVLTFVACHNLNRSRIGRAFAAIRLDETAARACGVNVARTKLTAFAVSGFIGGVGGAIYAVWVQTVAVKGLDVWQSILILCCIVLGGMGSLRGVALGTLVLMSLGELLREDIGGISIPAEARFLIYGLLLIIVMRFRPQGMLPPDRREEPLTPQRERALADGPCGLCRLPAPTGGEGGGA